MKDMPGPGEYKYKNMNVGVDARKFSFLRRTKNVYGKSLTKITRNYHRKPIFPSCYSQYGHAVEPENIMKKGNVPGPGTYAPVIEINSVGKYHLSTTP